MNRPRDLGSTSLEDAAAFERMFGDDTPTIADLLVPDEYEAYQSEFGA